MSRLCSKINPKPWTLLTIRNHVTLDRMPRCHLRLSCNTHRVCRPHPASSVTLGIQCLRFVSGQGCLIERDCAIYMYMSPGCQCCQCGDGLSLPVDSSNGRCYLSSAAVVSLLHACCCTYIKPRSALTLWPLIYRGLLDHRERIGSFFFSNYPSTEIIMGLHTK